MDYKMEHFSFKSWHTMRVVKRIKEDLASSITVRISAQNTTFKRFYH